MSENDELNEPDLSMDQWLALSDAEQLATVARYLGAHAEGRSITHGRGKRNRWILVEIAAEGTVQHEYTTTTTDPSRA